MFVGNPIRVQEKVRYLFFHYLRKRYQGVHVMLPSHCCSELDLTSYSVRSCPEEEVKNVSLKSIENNLEMEKLEEKLEPGFGPTKIISKETELQFIKDHPSIPEEMKADFIEFLSEREELFSGTEFSKKHFPADKYQHDVELLEPLTHLSSRPFPVAGIRLQQLKDDIEELVKNGIFHHQVS